MSVAMRYTTPQLEAELRRIPNVPADRRVAAVVADVLIEHGGDVDAAIEECRRAAVSLRQHGSSFEREAEAYAVAAELIRTQGRAWAAIVRAV